MAIGSENKIENFKIQMPHDTEKIDWLKSISLGETEKKPIKMFKNKKKATSNNRKIVLI